jgi:hypothetical protein
MTKALLWSACATALLLSTGCDSGETECGEPLYGGRATDEAWRAMVDAQKKPMDASRAVTLVSPEPGQTYAADAAPPRWSWTSPLRASLVRPASGGMLAQAHRRARPSVLAWVGELLVPTAEAHLPPFTGDLYWVQVTVPGRQCPVEVLTSELEWQLDAESWKALGEAAGQELSIQVTSAYLKDNQVTEGPYRLDAPRPFRRSGGTP